MNLPNVIKARDLMIEVRDAGAKRFDMSEYFRDNLCRVFSIDDSNPDPHECGTSACLAGWIQMRFAEGKDRDQPAWIFAEKFLEVTREDGEDLFTEASIYDKKYLDEVTVDDVINKLNWMIGNAD